MRGEWARRLRWCSETLGKVLVGLRSRNSWRDLPAADVLLVCRDTDRSYVLKGQRYSPILDSIGERLRREGFTTASVASRMSRHTGMAAFGNPVSIARVLLGVAARAMCISMLAGRQASRDWKVRRESALWRRMLMMSGPTAVLAIQPDESLCRAAFSLGIAVYDVQHGVVSVTAPGSYYYVKRLNALPLSDIPHGYLCWDEASAMELRSATVRNHAEVLVVGNPWLRRFAEMRDDDALVREELLLLTASAKVGRPSILVTLQYDQSRLAEDFAPNGYLVESLVDVIRESPNTYQWHLRLHPSQLIGPEATRVDKFLRACFGGRTNVEWQAASRSALPALLTIVDLHLTHYSAATYEAAAFGVPTGLLSPHFEPGGRHANLFGAERESGLAVVLSHSTRVIREFIENACNLREARVANVGRADLSVLVERLRSLQKDRDTHSAAAIVST